MKSGNHAAKITTLVPKNELISFILESGIFVSELTRSYRFFGLFSKLTEGEKR